MRRILIAAVIMALLMSGCIAAIQETEPGAAQPTVEELLADALKYYNAGNYEEAILLYETVIEIQHSDDQRSGGGIVVQAVVLLDGEITLVFRTILCFLNVNQILQHCRSVGMPVFGV